ncbi:MAG: hypothetical protein Q4C47_03445, partial [Planctomycetia bacterium]|nr:hypothetical protein [Planctomycetia bacterium]
MSKKNRYTKEHFINRELSWLEFNDRVLREGCNKTVPLLERLKFLAIVRSNLDEFFMVRVAGLMQQRSAGIEKPDPSGMPPSEQLAKISERVHRLIDEQTRATTDVLTELATEGLIVLESSQWDESQRRETARLFRDEVAPVATPVAFGELPEPPLLANLQTYVGLLLEGRGTETGKERTETAEDTETAENTKTAGGTENGKDKDREKPGNDRSPGTGKAPDVGKESADQASPVIAVIPVPHCLARFFPITGARNPTSKPGGTGGTGRAFVTVEEILRAHAAELFPGRKV